jgi:cytochrome c oxidase assembly factor CtaG
MIRSTRTCYGAGVGLPSPTALEWSPLLVATVAGTALVSARLRLGAGSGRPAAGAGRQAGPGNPADPPNTGARNPGWRTASTVAGIVLLGVAFISPLATLAGHYLLTAHLIQVTLVMGFAPPLLLLGLPRELPPAPRPLRAVGHLLVHPACAIVLVNLVFFGWHAPVLYEAALREPSLYALQQVSLFLVSLAFWWAIVEPTGKGPWSMSGLFKLGYILLATIPQTFAGLLFALAHHTFYAPYAAAPRVTGLDALGDQQLAGALMAILSKLALFGAFSVILWRLLDAQEHEDEQGDDGGHGGDDDRPHPVPPGTPAWLDMLRRGRTVPEPQPQPKPVLSATPGHSGSGRRTS